MGSSKRRFPNDFFHFIRDYLFQNSSAYQNTNPLDKNVPSKREWKWIFVRDENRSRSTRSVKMFFFSFKSLRKTNESFLNIDFR